MKLELPGSWKTSVVGLVTAFAAFVEFDKSIHFPQWLESLANFLMIGGLAAFGFVAKDSNVTGGTTLNTKNDPTVSGTPAVTPSPSPPAATK